jgi:hypothetical protein
MKPAVTITVVFLVLVAFLHLLRLIFGVAITVNDRAIPMWASVLAVIGLGALAGWVWREQLAPRPPGA